jgi:chromosome partitioning protein
MSIITLATTKGGAGKTTLARLILGRLAHEMRCAAIDTDFNRTLTDWVRTIAKLPVAMHHVLDPDEILPLASKLHDSHDLIVIDTAGAAERAMAFAMGCANLVMIPVQPSLADFVEAVKTNNFVRILKSPMPARLILMAVQATTNLAEHIETEIGKAELPLMTTRISRLVAFQEMSFNGIAPVTGTAGAQATALLDELTALGVLPIPQKLAS